MARGGKRVSKAVMQAKAKSKQFDAPPQGKGPTKRTPRSLIEQQQLAKEELFEPECVVAERVHGGTKQFQVKWAGWASTMCATCASVCQCMMEPPNIGHPMT